MHSTQKPKAKARSYEKFTIDDLRQLLECDEYRSGSFREPFQYWLPVLGLYTGARLEELAQLHLADVHEAPTAPGIHVFDITVEVDEEEGAETGFLWRWRTADGVKHSEPSFAHFYECMAHARTRGHHVARR